MPSKVLVVDDESGVRIMVSRVLEHAGYRVLQAEDGLEALELIRQLNGDLDLLLTDIQMPGMNGNELVSRCLSQYPDLKILCISAYTDAMSPSGHYFWRSRSLRQRCWRWSERFWVSTVASQCPRQ